MGRRSRRARPPLRCLAAADDRRRGRAAAGRRRAAARRRRRAGDRGPRRGRAGGRQHRDLRRPDRAEDGDLRRRRWRRRPSFATCGTAVRATGVGLLGAGHPSRRRRRGAAGPASRATTWSRRTWRACSRRRPRASTSTSACPTRRPRSGSPTRCGCGCRCWPRWPPTRPSATAPTAAWRAPAPPRSAPTRASKCRASSATTRSSSTVADQLIAAAGVDDYTYIWWDVRPHPKLGTVEVRGMDVQPTAAANAALRGADPGAGGARDRAARRPATCSARRSRSPTTRRSATGWRRG